MWENELRTLEHKGSSDKNKAKNDNTNNAIYDLEYQNNADKTHDKPKSKCKPRKVVEDLREGKNE